MSGKTVGEKLVMEYGKGADTLGYWRNKVDKEVDDLYRAHDEMLPHVKESEVQIYTSSTSGEITTTFTTRHLMQSLRECIQAAIDMGHYDVHDQALSRARGKLVAYIARLEKHNQRANKRAVEMEDQNRKLASLLQERDTEIAMLKLEAKRRAKR